MKKNLLPLIVVLFCLLPPQAWGQYPEFASAFLSPYTTTCKSLIRAIDDTSALVYYYDSSRNRNIIARIGLTMSCRMAVLPENCSVNDMRITDDHVYFCGAKDATPVIGYINLGDFASSTRTVKLFEVESPRVTTLNRMAAYTIGGQQKVVLVGDLIYTDPAPLPSLDCPYFYLEIDESTGDTIIHVYYNCHTSVVIEMNFYGDTYSSGSHIYTNDLSTNQVEFISEVIETDNHVAFVGYYTTHGKTVIHKCEKNYVISSFQNDIYEYSDADGGLGYYHGCQMNGDTIAVSSLSTYTNAAGVTQFSTNIRTFDLVNGNNTSSFKVLHDTKTEPLDLMYMPKDYRLVLLQEIPLPSAGTQFAFLHHNPYSPTSYAANCWYEANWRKPFNSISYLDGPFYVASGGNYWCMKKLDPFNTNNCYKYDVMKVEKINVTGITNTSRPYPSYFCSVRNTAPTSVSVNESMIQSCP